jgi:hypothetical protein
MVFRLATSTPQPTHRPKPSSPLSRQRLRYSRRFMTLMRPSIPARKRLALLYHLCRSCSSRSVFLLPALGQHTFSTPISLAICSFSLWSARCGPPPQAQVLYRTSADDPQEQAPAGLHHQHCPPGSRTHLRCLPPPQRATPSFRTRFACVPYPCGLWPCVPRRWRVASPWPEPAPPQTPYGGSAKPPAQVALRSGKGSSEILGAEGRSSSILRTRSAYFMLSLATSTNLS